MNKQDIYNCLKENNICSRFRGSLCLPPVYNMAELAEVDISISDGG
ncbi:MAG: hypothetical protein ACLVIY_04835 [Anaerobutyricum soehngenii]